MIIIGAGGHAREVHDIVEDLGLSFEGFIADTPPNLDLLASRGPWLGPLNELASYAGSGYVIAIGDGRVRSRLAKVADDLGLVAATLIHPSAIIGKHNVDIGGGTVICANCIVTTDIYIGRHVHLNRSAQVGHDVRIEDFATVHPGSVLSGNVQIGEGVTIGSMAVLIPGRSVGEWSTVGAGAAVTKDVAPNVLAVGVPARSL